MSFLLVVANLVVLTVYLGSTAMVVWSLLPALYDVLKVVNKVASSLLRTIGELLYHPASRVLAHGFLYAACFYIVAAGVIVAPKDQLEGVIVSMFGQLLAAGLTIASSSGSSGEK